MPEEGRRRSDMAEQTAIVKFEEGKKDLAKYRAEKRLASLTTNMSRLEQSAYYSVMFLASFSLGLLSILIFWDLFLANYYEVYTQMALSSVGNGIYCAVVSPVLMLFTLVANKISVREKFKTEEMKRLNAEEAGLMLAKKRLLQHPGNEELRLAYENFVEEVRASRREGEDEDEVLQLEGCEEGE